MNKILLIALTLAVLSPSLASAADIKTRIRPVIGRDGKLAFCIAEQRHPGDRILTFGYSPKDNMYVSATIPKAGFKKKARYDFKLILDGGFNRKVRGVATSKDTVLVDMNARPAFKKALIGSSSLKLIAHKNTIAFDLSNMMRVISTLKKCIKYDPSKVPAKNAAPAQPSGSAFPRSLMKLLTDAGFKTVTPLSMENVPKDERPADYIWKTDEILGGVRSRKAPKDSTMTSLIGLHVKGLREKCKGKFSARIGRGEKVHGRDLRRATATCGPYEGKKGRAVSVALLFMLSQKGGFTVFTHEADIGKQDKALAVRDQLASFLLTLK